MAKPESGGGSLEDILASIRRGLAEQSTDVLTEDAPAQKAEQKATDARRSGLVGRLANATAGLTSRAEPAPQDDLSDMLVATEPAAGTVPQLNAKPEAAAPKAEAAAPLPPAAAPEPAPAPEPQNDPLWFLTRNVEANKPKEPEEPALTPPGEVRASMPPFFGASPETVRVDTPPVVETPPPARPLFGTALGPAATDSAIQREVSLVAAAAETAARPGSAPAANGVAEPRPAPAASGPAPALQGSQALEAMVLELLKPMLREWLDQNMPRMVAEALKAEADRVGVGANAKKP
jgi:cell pole-organizing protein PopZ